MYSIISALSAECQRKQEVIIQQQAMIEQLQVDASLLQTRVDHLETDISDFEQECTYLEDYARQLECADDDEELVATAVPVVVVPPPPVVASVPVPSVPTTIGIVTRRPYADVVQPPTAIQVHQVQRDSDTRSTTSSSDSSNNGSNTLAKIYRTDVRGYDCECAECHHVMKLHLNMCKQAKRSKSLGIACEMCHNVSAWIRHCSEDDCHNGVIVSRLRRTDTWEFPTCPQHQ